MAVVRPPVYIVTVNDKLYKVCPSCRVSQAVWIMIDRGRVIMACGVCQYIIQEVIV